MSVSTFTREQHPVSHRLCCMPGAFPIRSAVCAPYGMSTSTLLDYFHHAGLLPECGAADWYVVQVEQFQRMRGGGPAYPGVFLAAEPPDGVIQVRVPSRPHIKSYVIQWCVTSGVAVPNTAGRGCWFCHFQGPDNGLAFRLQFLSPAVEAPGEYRAGGRTPHMG